MSWLALAWANLRNTPLSSAVNAFLMALGTASIVLLLLAGEHFARVIARDAHGIDLVVGAKGSPIQLVLSSVYHADIPTGNIPLHEANVWAEDPRVARAIPLSLGDNYRGFRIVGTTPDYAGLYSATLAHGAFWTESMQAVVGSAVARQTQLQVSDTFAGAHGLSTARDHQHERQPYRVVGVLEKTGTVLDRLILTSTESVWELHDEHHVPHSSGHQEPHALDHLNADYAEPHEPESDGPDHEDHDGDREITALLLSYATPLAATSLPREIDRASNLQEASPAFELARLLQLVGIGRDGLLVFAGILILTAGFSVFAALYGALKARRFDLAMLRCLGASREELLLSLLLEGLMLTAAGVAAGLTMGHIAMAALGSWLEARRGVMIDSWIWLPTETVLVFGLLGVGILAALLPAWQAYRTDVAQTLAGN